MSSTGEYVRYKDSALREECTSRGLPSEGTRNELIARLVADDANSASRYIGRVVVPNSDDPPSISSLVAAFEDRDERASEAIVLRGYLGRSNLLQRVVEYLGRAKGVAENPDLTPRQALRNLCESLPGDDDDPLPPEVDIDWFIGTVDLLGEWAKTHIPWRLYLTPRLDRYVDFHFNDMLAYRREPKAERQDACTVWLRLFEKGGRVPTPYRVVQVTNLGPSYAGWLGGELVDDYLDQPGGFSTAWDNQAGPYAKYTTPRCGE
jgi:SAP domain